MTATPFDWATRNSYRAGGLPWPAGYPDDTATYFSPEDGDGIKRMLLDLIGVARHSLVLNMYGYADADVDGALFAKADDPNIYFQMSLDRTQASGAHEKQILAHWYDKPIGTSIAIGQSVKHAISHLKVLIVDGVWVVSGSTNWSLSGLEAQDNQCTISQNAVLAAQYRSILDIVHLEMIKQQARRDAAAKPTG
jgi:phosphatidylserine/phosphatidylglycerophosphate/cardiolipin synthase-like enzyme